MIWPHHDEPLEGTVLLRDQLLPDVALTDAGSGRVWRPAQLRQRSAAVLCFLHAGCRRCQEFLAALADLREGFRWAEAQVRVVLPEPETCPFPVAVDQAGQARERLLGPDGQIPTVVVADRYTAASESFPAVGHAFPEPAQVLSAVRHLAVRCPECSV